MLQALAIYFVYCLGCVLFFCAVVPEHLIVYIVKVLANYSHAVANFAVFHVPVVVN